MIRVIRVQMMNTVCVVPVDTEIFRSRFQVCKSSHSLIWVRLTARVRIERNAPDSLHTLVIIYIFFNKIHIRTFTCHRNVDHLDPEVFRDREMSVISRDRAEEFHLVKSAPRRTSAYPVRPGTAHGIEHQCQTRVSVHHDILGRRVHHRTHELFRLLDPGQDSVVSHITVRCHIITAAV